MAKRPKNACTKCNKPHAGKYGECRACRLQARARAQGWNDWAEKKISSRSLAAAAENTPRKKRTCLGCGNLFLSEGSHNRVCGFCKNTSAWRSGCETGIARVTGYMGGEL